MGPEETQSRLERLEMLMQVYSSQRATAGLDGLLSYADFAKLASMQVPVSRLAYAPGADLMNGAAVAATTWTDLSANQSFTVGSATAWLAVEIKLGFVATAAAASQLAARAVFNSAGTPVVIPFSAGIVPAAAGYGALVGSTFFFPPSVLPTGTATVKVQVFSNAACTAYCRPVTVPNTDFFGIRIVELSA